MARPEQVGEPVHRPHAEISWNCIGWQSLVLLSVSFLLGSRGSHPVEARIQVVVIGIAVTIGVTPAVLLHDYGGTLLVIAFLLGFWVFVHRWIPGTALTYELEVVA